MASIMDVALTYGPVAAAIAAIYSIARIVLIRVSKSQDHLAEVVQGLKLTIEELKKTIERNIETQNKIAEMINVVMRDLDTLKVMVLTKCNCRNPGVESERLEDIRG